MRIPSQTPGVSLLVLKLCSARLFRQSASERYVDLLITRRLKIPGASWSVKGANNMLKARNYFFNKEDDHS
ncbi:MAG: hypothetical protein ABIN54_05300 [candidate division WOR-3 bacterium]